MAKLVQLTIEEIVGLRIAAHGHQREFLRIAKMQTTFKLNLFVIMQIQIAQRRQERTQ
jgi:hypothetical protein